MEAPDILALTTLRMGLQNPQLLPRAVRALQNERAFVLRVLHRHVIERDGAADDFDEGGGLSPCLEVFEKFLGARR